MNVYILKVDLKEAEYGGNRYIEPERTVLELASDDKMKFTQKSPRLIQRKSSWRSEFKLV